VRLSLPLAALMVILAMVAPGGARLAAADDRATLARAELAALSSQVAVISHCFNLVDEIVAPSVVSIRTSEEILNPYAERNTEEIQIGEGSGFVVYSDDQSSYILTNAHVVLKTNNDQEFLHGPAPDNRPVGYDRLVVQLNDDREFEASYVGCDISTDLAVVKVAIPHLPPVEWGDSDKSRVGDWVLALGYPLGVGFSATSGIISATDRSTGIYHEFKGLESFIQTDASINPGNSGGPLVGIDAKIIGVNSNIVSRTGVNIGIGFAIPSNLARRVAEDLIRYGTVHWPGIGVDLDELTPELAVSFGLPDNQAVFVEHVLPKSPAEAGGVHANDIVVAVNQTRIHSLMNFRARVALGRIGEPMTLRVFRAGKEVDLTVVPVSRDAVLSEDHEHEVELKGFGLRVAIEDGPGLVVTEVESGSVADLAHVAVGDRLLQERLLHELRTIEDARALAKRQEIIVQILHGERAVWLRLRR